MEFTSFTTNTGANDFYKNIICDDTNYIELRMFFKSGAISSMYFKSPEEILRYMSKNTYTNIYVGVNPRHEPGRKFSSIAYIKNIVFDIEAKGTKPELMIAGEFSDYAKKILTNIQHLNDYLFENYSLEISSVATSGRGMHVYITLQDKLPAKEYKTKYKLWYKSVCNHMNLQSPEHADIKCDSMCSDFTRILGAPGSMNIKYTEKPMREIIYLNTNTNNSIKNILDSYKVTEYKPPLKQASGERYNEDTIFSSPEFKVFEHRPIPGTQINNKLRLALRLLMSRDRLTNHDDVAQRISELGYPYKEMNFVERDYPDYKYSENILNHYVLDNFEWATDTGFKIPYKLKEEDDIKKYIKCIKINTDKEFIAEMKINNIPELLSEIKMFNNTFNKKTGSKIELYTKALESSINQAITNKKLKQFIEENNLINRLKLII
jgi:hypothetical protein